MCKAVAMSQGRVRHRSSGSKPTPGSLVDVSNGTPTTYTQTDGNWPELKVSDCADTVGNKDGDNIFSVEHSTATPGPITGQVVTAGGLRVRTYNAWQPILGQYKTSHLTLAPPTLNAATTQVLAKSNPGRRTISLPTAIGELKDLPSLIRQGGRALGTWLASRRSPRDARRYLDTIQAADGGAGIYLAYQFGIAPVISDVRKMLNFQAITERRFAELARLYSGKGLKRRITVYTGVASTQSSTTLESLTSLVISGNVTTFTQGQMWGTICWKPTKPPPGRSRQDLMRYANQIASGMNGANIQDAWNLMPWTWLIDWFSDTDDWLTATGRNVPASPSRINIMYKRTTKTFWQKTSHPTLSMQTASATLETKERTPRSGFTLPEANLGASLTSRQQSILGALAVTRHRFRGPR